MVGMAGEAELLERLRDSDSEPKELEIYMYTLLLFPYHNITSLIPYHVALWVGIDYSK